MPKVHLFVLLILVLLSLGGCQNHINVEPVSFGHEDEMVRRDDFIVLADRRVFAVMAFMNASGYDEEAQGKQMHPARARVRDWLKKKEAEYPEKFRDWKEYYEKANLRSFHYQHFALSLSTEYPFRRIRPDSELGYGLMARRLADFPAVLNEFWETADLDEIWAEVKPIYINEIRKYDFDWMERELLFVWDYLRMDRRDKFVFVSVPNLINMHYQAIGAKYENYWYMVESPGAGTYSINIHEYLHSIVNPMVEACYKTHSGKLNKYFKAGKDQLFAKNYGHPVTYTYECLVRALTTRLYVLMENNLGPGWGKSKVRGVTQNGLILVEPFYELLDEYEESNKNFEQFLPAMLDLLPEYSK